MARDRRAFIGSGIWDEPSIRELTRLQQQAYLLAYTQRDLSRCGVIAYRPRSWAKLAVDDDIESLHADYLALDATRHVVLDEDGQELFVRTYMRHDGLLTQPMVVAAAARAYSAITSPVIKTAVLLEVRRLWDLYDPAQPEHEGVRLLLGGRHDSAAVANAIGNGLVEPMQQAITAERVPPFTKTRGKPLPEGFRKGSAKGSPKPPGTRDRDTLRTRADTPSPESRVPAPGPESRPPSPSPAGPTDPAQNGGNNSDHAATTEQLLDATGPWTDKVRDDMAAYAGDALAKGFPPEAIKAALATWQARPGRKFPGLLPDLIQEAFGSHTPTSNGKRPPWCGECDETTRLLLDDQGDPLRRCPSCHPLTTHEGGPPIDPAVPTEGASP